MTAEKYFILTVFKYGSTGKLARIVFEQSLPAKILQHNLIVRGHSAILSEADEMPDRTSDEQRLALHYHNIGIVPLPPSVTGRTPV